MLEALVGITAGVPRHYEPARPDSAFVYIRRFLEFQKCVRAEPPGLVEKLPGKDGRFDERTGESRKWGSVIPTAPLLDRLRGGGPSRLRGLC